MQPFIATFMREVNSLFAVNICLDTVQLWTVVESSWNVMAHGDAREGKWRGNWRLEWVASTLHTISEHGVSSITTADAHTSAASSWLNWRPSANLNGLVHFAKRQNLVSVHVPSHFKCSLLCIYSDKERRDVLILCHIQLCFKNVI